MMVCVGDLIRWIDAYAPFRLAAAWDHCGLQVGNPASEVERVLVALDVSSRTLDEAIRLGCQVLVTHHPLIFRPMAAIREDEYPGRLVASAIRGRVSLIAAHTNLDIARGGTNDRLCGLMGLDDTVPLDTGSPAEAEGAPLGIGRVGSLPQAERLAGLARRLEDTLGGSKVRVVGKPEQSIQRVAVCTGSGGSLLDLALAAGVEAYVTGDLKYHEGQRALEEGVALIDVGHFASEHIIVHPLKEYLVKRSLELDAKLDVLESTEESDPFWYV
ncbi:MAG: Nif3-like dinuclear metal center hexameric protein [Syntrophobacteraceae bacterium]